MEVIALLVIVCVLVLITSLLSIRVSRLEKNSKLQSDAIIQLANSAQFFIELSKNNLLAFELLKQERE